MTDQTFAEAMSTIRSLTHWPEGECDYLGGYLWTRGPSGYGSATIHCETLRSKGLLHTTGTPPIGADVLFEGGSHGYGHRATSIGGGNIRSTDMLNGNYSPGNVSDCAISDIAKWGWGQHYVGWANPYYFGRQIADVTKQAGTINPMVANQTYALPGMDSSSYQGTNPSMSGDWYDIAKCTEGLHTLDVQYKNTIAWVRGQHKILGHYLFLDAGESVDGQVAWFVSQADVRRGEFVVLDWEAKGSTSADKDRALTLLMQHYHPLGIKVLLYTYVNMWLNVDVSSNCGDGLFIANPSGFAIKHPVVMTQAGVVHGADADYANFPSVAAFQAWINELPVKVAGATHAGLADAQAALAHTVASYHAQVNGSLPQTALHNAAHQLQIAIAAINK